MKYNISLSAVVNAIAFSNNGLFAAADNNRNFRLWSTSNGALVQNWTNHTGQILSLAFDSNNMLASGSADRTVKVWNISNRALVLDIATGHLIGDVAFGNNGVLASASIVDTNIQIHNSTTGALITNLTALGGSWAIAFDGTNLFAGGGANFIRLWNTTTWTAIRNLTGHQSTVLSVSFDKVSLIASGSLDQTIRLWNKYTGASVRILTGHTGNVYSVAFDSNGNLASGSSDGTIKIWRHNSNCNSSR